MESKDLEKELNELIRKAIQQGVPILFETPDGVTFEVGVANLYYGEIILAY